MSHIIISNFIQSLTKYVTAFIMCSYPSHWHSLSPKTIMLFYIQAHVIKKKKKLLSCTYSFSSSFISCWLYWRTFTTSTLACFKLSDLSPRALCACQFCVMLLCCPEIYSTSMFTSQNTAHMPKFCHLHHVHLGHGFNFTASTTPIKTDFNLTLSLTSAGSVHLLLNCALNLHNHIVSHSYNTC